MQTDGAPPPRPRLSDRIWQAALIVAYRLLRAWWFVRRPEGSGVHVAVWWSGQILLVRNSYRRPITVPSGGIHRRETPLAAARRELREEVGIDVAEDALVPGAEFVVDYESKTDRGIFFELTCAQEPAIRIDRREVTWAGFVAPEEIDSSRVTPHLRRYLETREAAERSR